MRKMRWRDGWQILEVEKGRENRKNEVEGRKKRRLCFFSWKRSNDKEAGKKCVVFFQYATEIQWQLYSKALYSKVNRIHQHGLFGPIFWPLIILYLRI